MVQFMEDPNAWEQKRTGDEPDELEVQRLKRRRDKQPLGAAWVDRVTHPALALACETPPRILLTGEAGIGKSRLTAALC